MRSFPQILAKPAVKQISLPQKRHFSCKSLPQPRKRNIGRRWSFRGATLLEDITVCTASSTSSSDQKTNASLSESELLHALNYLDSDGLQAFPGIGAFLAEKILEHRQFVDYFQNLEELLQVRLFGAKRFEKLVGRAPIQKKTSLHQLMRVESKTFGPITLAHFNPWRRPAPGIDAIWLIPAREYYQQKSTFSQSAKVIVESVGSYRLVFLCDAIEFKGRSNYIIRRLPKLIRSINYERSFTTANQ